MYSTLLGTTKREHKNNMEKADYSYAVQVSDTTMSP